MNDFLKQLAAILEVENVNASDPLRTFPQLDSLGVLSIIAMIDTNYGVNISTADLWRMNTVGDIWVYVQSLKDKNMWRKTNK